VLVTSGPGATNAVTGITDALMDSIPMVCITGQVPTHLIGTDAFQEADTVGITRHCTKHNYLVKDPRRSRRVLHEAFHVAPRAAPARSWSTFPRTSSSRPRATSGPRPDRAQDLSPAGQGRHPATIRAAVELIAKAERPIFYTGGGVINSGTGSRALLRELAASPARPSPRR
jgi:acetolactate synthase-1/2/3 large subunit